MYNYIYDYIIIYSYIRIYHYIRHRAWPHARPQAFLISPGLVPRLMLRLMLKTHADAVFEGGDTISPNPP